MAFFGRGSRSELFPNRQPLRKSELVPNVVLQHLGGKYSENEIFVISLDENQIPSLLKMAQFPLYSWASFIAYPENFEQELYDLIHTPRQQEPKSRQTTSADPRERLSIRPTATPAAQSEPAITEEELAEQFRAAGLAEPEQKKTPRKKGARTHQVKTRLSDKELESFNRRVEKSGKPQGEFIREMLLTGRVVVREVSAHEVALIDEVERLRADLGRVGGLLKSTIKPNEGSTNISREEWEIIFGAIRELEKLKGEVQSMGVNISRGNRKTQ